MNENKFGRIFIGGLLAFALVMLGVSLGMGITVSAQDDATPICVDQATLNNILAAPDEIAAYNDYFQQTGWEFGKTLNSGETAPSGSAALFDNHVEVLDADTVLTHGGRWMNTCANVVQPVSEDGLSADQVSMLESANTVPNAINAFNEIFEMQDGWQFGDEWFAPDVATINGPAFLISDLVSGAPLPEWLLAQTADTVSYPELTDSQDGTWGLFYIPEGKVYTTPAGSSGRYMYVAPSDESTTCVVASVAESMGYVYSSPKYGAMDNHPIDKGLEVCVTGRNGTAWVQIYDEPVQTYYWLPRARVSFDPAFDFASLPEIAVQ